MIVRIVHRLGRWVIPGTSTHGRPGLQLDPVSKQTIDKHPTQTEDLDNANTRQDGWYGRTGSLQVQLSYKV